MRSLEIHFPHQCCHGPPLPADWLPPPAKDPDNRYMTVTATEIQNILHTSRFDSATGRDNVSYRIIATTPTTTAKPLYPRPILRHLPSGMESSKMRPYPKTRPHRHFSTQKPVANIVTILPRQNLRENPSTTDRQDRKTHHSHLPEQFGSLAQ